MYAEAAETARPLLLQMVTEFMAVPQGEALEAEGSGWLPRDSTLLGLYKPLPSGLVGGKPVWRHSHCEAIGIQTPKRMHRKVGSRTQEMGK